MLFPIGGPLKPSLYLIVSYPQISALAMVGLTIRHGTHVR